VRPGQSERIFRELVVRRGSAVERLTPHEGFDAMLRFCADDRLSHGDVEQDDDMLLFQWGTYDWGAGPQFEFDDTDGKRFVLARRNRPGVRDLGALTVRERQVATYAACGFSLKHVGYALGLSVPTVSQHLKAALRKLRLASRAELVATLGAGVAGAEAGPR
jgi:DNA-binding CsgD family transcriptional regulator